MSSYRGRAGSLRPGARGTAASPRRRPARAGPGGRAARPPGPRWRPPRPARAARTAPPGARRGPAGPGPPARSASSGAPPKSQITVRSLSLRVEAQPVVDGPQPILGQQHVAALAVGVVGHDVEGAEAHQLGVPLGLVAEREVVRGAVLVHEALHRPWPERPFGRAPPSRAPAPSRGLRRGRRRPPRVGTARRGSPTAAARPCDGL